MANRSDRDPPSLHVILGDKPVRRMRRGSADSIGASRAKSCANRPDIELQPACQAHQIVPRKPGGVHIVRHERKERHEAGASRRNPARRTRRAQAVGHALSKALGVPVNRVTMILNGQRGVSADTALRLARYFGTTPQLWLNLQKTWELRRAEIAAGREIAKCVTPRRSAASGAAADARP